jgi:CHASE3 domain sensor protein
MNNEQQTAVDWLVKRVESISNDKSLTKEDSIRLYNQAIEHSKKMEMEQKANTWNNAINAVEKDKWESFEQYYNETYGRGNP